MAEKNFRWLSTLAKMLIIAVVAISVLPAPLLGQEVIIDNDSPGTSYAGGLWGYSSGLNPYDGSSRAEMQAGATYTFQTAVTGDKVVSLWWTYWASRCTAVPVDIYDGNTRIDTVPVNQQRLDLAGDWNELGTYTFNNAARVVIRAQSGCSANADAVLFEDAAPPVLSYIEVTGPVNVNENSSADYDCIAHYENGSSREVEADEWSETCGDAYISQTGLLTTGEVTSSQPCTVSARYTENGIPRDDELGVTINDYVPPVELVIDNGGSGTSATGLWYVSGGVPPIGVDNLYSKTPGSIYRYQTPLDGYYEVHLYWTYWNSRCTSVPVRIYDGNQLVASTTVNQAQNGGDWYRIGSSGYHFSGTARVEIQATSTSCSTCADAVKFVSVVPPVLTSIVITGPGSVNENSSVDYACMAYYTDGSSHAVEPTWSEDSDYATISSTGLLTTTNVGATQPPFNISATYTENGITQDDDHAIIIENYVPPAEIIIDNDDPGTLAEGGPWGYSSGLDPYDGSSRAESRAGATYTFQGDVTGDQVVSLWWTYWSSRCTAVPVDIFDGNTLLDTVPVDQRRLDLAGDWNVLGTYTFNNAARVVIRAQSGCSACADAVKFESSGPSMVAVPNCVNITQASAQTLITDAGLVMGSITTAHHATFPVGNVISTTPVGGTEVPVGTSVNLLVSDGPENTAPTATGVSIAGTAEVGQELTGNYTYNDANGDLEGTSTFRWLRDGAEIPGAVAKTYTLIAGDLNAMIIFEVTPVAQTGVTPGTAVQSGAVGPVAGANTAPTATGVSISGTTQVGQELTGNYTYNDANGDLEGTSTFRWLRDGAEIPGAVAKTYTLIAGDLNAMIIFEVTPVAQTGVTPGTAVQSGAVGPVAGANTAPTATGVSIAGTAEVGQELTGNYTYNDANGDLEGTSTFRWLADEVEIPGATDQTYTPVGADQGTMISFEVTPVAATGTSPGVAVESDQVGPVAPAPNVAPTHDDPLLGSSSGTSTTDEDLICSAQNVFDANGDDIYLTYNWYKDGTSLANLNLPCNTEDAVTATDYSGYGNHGAVNGAAWTSDGIIGGAYSFDGVDDYISVPDASTLDGDGTWDEMTIEFWVRSGEDNQIEATMVEKRGASSGNIRSYQVGFPSATPSQLFCGLYVTGGYAEVGAANAQVTGVWYHVAVTYKDGVGIKLYVDGVLDDENTGASGTIRTSPGAAVNLGRRADGVPSRYFNGNLDEVKIYPFALTPEQIAQNYNQSKDGLSDESTIVSKETLEGDQWDCMVTPSDLTADGDTKQSGTLTIGASTNTAPTATGVSISGTTQVGQELTGNYTYNDANGDLEGTSTFRWLADEVEIPGATDQTYTPVGADQGTMISFEVTPVAATGTSPGVAVESDQVGPVAPAPNVAPTHDDPLLGSSSGTSTTDEDLICSAQNVFDANGDDIYLTYNWYKDGTSLANLNLPCNTEDAVTATDYSGYGNHGAVNGAAWTSDGIIGGAYSFDGVDDYISVPDASTLDGDGTWDEMTIEFWVRSGEDNQIEATMVEKRGASSGNIRSYQVGFPSATPSQLFCGLYVTGGYAEVGAANAQVTGVWYHVAVTYKDGVGIKLYVDGVLDDENTGASGTIRTSPGAAVNLGRRADGVPSRYFNGNLDEVKIYPFALTPEQIAQNYNQSKDGLSDESTIVSKETLEGDQWDCMVTPSDLTADGDTKQSGTLTIGASTNTAPTATGVSISGTTQVGQELTGNYTYNDANGDLEGTSTFRWLADEVEIPGATDQTYTPVGADQGTMISFEVTPVAATGTSPGVAVESDQVGPVAPAPNVAPTHDDPLLGSSSGTSTTDEDLICSAQNVFDANGDDIYLTYNWYKDGTSLANLNLPCNTEDAVTATDYSGYGNHGAVNGAAWTSDGIIGGAYSFDGVDDYISVPDASTLDGDGTWDEMTIEFWVRSGEDNQIEATMVEKRGASSGNIRSYQVGFPSATPSQLFCGLYVTGGYAEVGAANAQVTGVWYHVAVTYKDGVGIKLYVDGVLDDENTGASGTIRTSPGAAVNLGRRADGVPSRYFNGNLDEVKIYPFALTPEQIAQNYNQSKDGLSDESTIVSKETLEGDQWDCMVTPSDLTADGDTKQSGTLTIGASTNTAPTATGVSISGTTQVGQELTGNYTYNDANGDLEGTSTFRWLADEVEIPGATDQTYTPVGADQGTMISFEVTPVAATGTSPGVAVESDQVGPVGPSGTNTAPTATAVSIIGTPTVGQVLIGGYLYNDSDGDLEGTSTFRWLADDVEIPGATDQTYTPVGADQGTMISFEVTPIAQSGELTGAAVQSAAVGPVLPQPDISIDTSFDGGDSASIGPGPVVNGNEITFTLKEDNVLDGSCPYRYWFNFKVANVAGRQITFNLTDIGGSCPVPFYTEATEENQVVYSCDGITWNRFTDHSYSTDGNGTYTFTETFACDEVQVATFFPFSYTKMQNYIDTLSASEWVTTELLGTSTEGREIELLTITNDASPDPDKEDIFIVGRQHAAENGSSYMIQGLIDFLISNDVDAATLRDQYTWYIVPMVNPDGVALGKSRETSLGNDANRDWGNTDSVEINTVRDRIDLIDSTQEIDFFIDWHTQMNDDSWRNFIYSPSGNTFFNILSDWTDFDTQSASGASACSSVECSCRGYIMNNILYDPTFTFEPTPHLVTWTLDTLREQGVLVGYAINEHFGGVGGPLLVDSEFENSADSEALRENSPGQDWWESRNIPPSALLTLDTSNVGGNNSKKAGLKNFDAGGNAYVTQNFGTPQNGSFSVSVDMYIDRIKDDADYDRTGYIFIGTDGVDGNGPNSTSAERFVFLTFYDPTPGDSGNDLELRAREFDNDTGTPAPDQPWAETSTWTPVVSGLSYDAWYTITVDVHVGSGTYNVLVEDNNGLDVAHVTGIKKFEKYTSANVTHISFHTGDQGSGDFYVDSVYEVVNLPDLNVSPTFLDFGTNQNTLTFEVENVGDEPFSWEASVDQPWVTAIVPDNSGGLMNIGESVTVSVTIDRDLFGAALPDLNCRMWGAVSDTGIPSGIFGPDLISDPNSLKNLTSATSNEDGWAVAHYFELGDTPLITRGAEYAAHSTAYDNAVNSMAALSPKIALAHVRNCTSGCCEDGQETCDDPHPFHRDKNGKTWLFMHNGGISKTVMRNLIGETYLEANWPNGSEVGQCDPGTYAAPNWDNVVDSELYFLFVLKSIENNGWNVQQGIIDATTQMLDAISGSSETINFIMSDGLNVWGFRKGHDLAYYFDPVSGYAAVASQPSNPGGSESWTIMNDYQLVTLRPGQTPQVLDVRDPGTQYAATITILNSNGESVNVSVVADGPEPATVPNTVNLPLATAEAQIAAAGFLVGDIAYKYSPNVAPGNVIIQSHTAGSALLQGSEIDLVVSEPVVIIDNGDPGVTDPYGNWQPSSGPNPYGGQSLYVSNDGTATYTWTFSPAVSGFYNVSMWWTTLTSRSTNIPVEIEYVNDAETVYINQRQNGGQWNSLGSYYYEAGNSYDVILHAVGGGNSNCADAVRFTKENILRHKYTVDLPGGDQMMPVMGDIDGDGVQEIVVAAGYYVVAIDGETGEIEWSVSGASYTAVELVDLNGDGIPEILHGMRDSTGPRLRALNGDGSMRWTSAYLPGEEVALFPIVAYDIKGDGYPTIFFATQDYEPDPYSGNINDYNGALVKLDHNGNILDSTWIQKPCWGGMALGDANFDGAFEIYLGDRRDGYHDIPSNGMQAFDAHTLSTLWTRPDIHHSSPLPILADVTGDTNLEVVATKITLAGPIVLNSETGNTITDYSNMNLPTHGTPTVCDIDEDGHLEVIYSTSYPESAPKKFVVFDLVTGKIDFEASFDFWITWPPSVGDVTGDGHMEIIVAAGSQEDSVGDTHDDDYPILVYNKDFKLIDIVELDIKAGQLTPARVFDTDSDGYNEVVVPGFNNKLMVYDTSAYTPNPAPRTWVQKYSEYRQGVPEYVELPLAPTVASTFSTRMALDAAPEIVDHHEFLPLEDEPDDAKGYSGYE